MQLLSLLEVTIGLVLLYALTSIVVSAVVESIAGVLRSRAKNLVVALRQMVGADRTHAFFHNHLIKSLTRPGRRDSSRPDHVRGPSYIPPDLFSWVVADWLFEDGDFAGRKSNASYELQLERFPESARRMLRHFIDRSDDVARFRAQLESWFDAVMERAAGWYARRARFVAVLIGFLVAAAMNIDTIAVSSTLISDAGLRRELVEFAESLEEHGVDPGSENERAALELLGSISGTTPAIGWSRAVASSVHNAYGDKLRHRVLSWGLKVVGWFITAVAASLGASFWFDRLAILMRVRMAGKSETQSKPKAPADAPTKEREALEG